jgi:hypothetical protein
MTSAPDKVSWSGAHQGVLPTMRGPSVAVLGGGGKLRCTPMNDGKFQVLLQPGWGKDEVSNPMIGRERHEEGSPTGNGGGSDFIA